MTNTLAEATGARCCILHQDEHVVDRPLCGGAQCARRVRGRDDLYGDQDRRPPRERGGAVASPGAVRRYTGQPARRAVAASLYVQNWLAVPSVVFATQRARDCGGLDESLWYTADWDLWLKLLRHGPSVLIGEVGSAFRIHGRSRRSQAAGM